MRSGPVFTLLVGCALYACLLTGCAPKLLDRDAFEQRYQDTALTEGVLSAVPSPSAFIPATPPTVVNWWYVGSRAGQHYLVLRELSWDDAGKPVGRESRYRIAASALLITEPFDKTSDEASWVAVYQAAAEVPPPVDLPTQRRVPGAEQPDAVTPQPREPRSITPDRPLPPVGEPLPIPPPSG